jgi:hypothetical protein
MGSASPVK